MCIRDRFYAVPVAFIGAYYKVPVFLLVAMADFSEFIKLVASLIKMCIRDRFKK